MSKDGFSKPKNNVGYLFLFVVSPCYRQNVPCRLRVHLLFKIRLSLEVLHSLLCCSSLLQLISRPLEVYLVNSTSRQHLESYCKSMCQTFATFNRSFILLGDVRQKSQLSERGCYRRPNRMFCLLAFSIKLTRRYETPHPLPNILTVCFCLHISCTILHSL